MRKGRRNSYDTKLKIREPFGALFKTQTDMEGIIVNWVTENREGGFLGHELKPKRQELIWVSDGDMCTLTPEEADALCSRLPIWDDQEPTQVKL